MKVEVNEIHCEIADRSGYWGSELLRILGSRIYSDIRMRKSRNCKARL